MYVWYVSLSLGKIQYKKQQVEFERAQPAQAGGTKTVCKKVARYAGITFVSVCEGFV